MFQFEHYVYYVTGKLSDFTDVKHENQLAHDFVTTGAQRMLESVNGTRCNIRLYSEVSA